MSYSTCLYLISLSGLLLSIIIILLLIMLVKAAVDVLYYLALHEKTKVICTWETLSTTDSFFLKRSTILLNIAFQGLYKIPISPL